MKEWMRFSIKKTLLGGFLFIIVILIVYSFGLYKNISIARSQMDTIYSETLPHTLSLQNLEKEVIQIQQWLTDISATRGMEGFDDGFTEAEKYYQQAQKNISGLLVAHSNEPKMHQTLTDLSSALDQYYKVGREMADVYIQYGPEDVLSQK